MSMIKDGPVQLPREGSMDGAGGSATSAAVPTFREEFGSVLLEVKAGAGRLTLPAKVEAHALADLRLALLDALARCSSLVLDWGGVSQCDIFFFQLLCSAQHTCSAQGIPLRIEGTLDDDLGKAAKSMGFGCRGTAGCLFNLV